MIRIGKYIIFNEDTYNIKLKIVNDKGETLFYDKDQLEKIFDEFFKEVKDKKEYNFKTVIGGKLPHEHKTNRT